MTIELLLPSLCAGVFGAFLGAGVFRSAARRSGRTDLTSDTCIGAVAGGIIFVVIAFAFLLPRLGLGIGGAL